MVLSPLDNLLFPSVKNSLISELVSANNQLVYEMDYTLNYRLDHGGTADLVWAGGIISSMRWTPGDQLIYRHYFRVSTVLTVLRVGKREINFTMIWTHGD
jgi:hypothetical protein